MGRNSSGQDKIVVGITTYKRPDCLLALTKRLKELHDCIIVVYDDCGRVQIDSTYIDHLINGYRHNGKKGYWRSVNKLWFYVKKYNPTIYINLVDDLLPNDNFFDCIDIFKRIDDNAKIAMHLANNGRTRNWTNFDRVSFNDEVFKTQTTEQSFICYPEFISRPIPKIPLSRWRFNENLGSGVGAELNTYWVSRKKTIFGVKESLITRNDNCDESMMNPEERKLNPWQVL